MKQQDALLAKGRLLGIQFDSLFKDNFYMCIGVPAIIAAEKIRKALIQLGYELYFESHANQKFVVLENTKMIYFITQKYICTKCVLKN